MTPRQIVFVMLMGVGLLILVLELIRRQMLREKYALLWFFISIMFLTVPWLYDVYAWFAVGVGIVNPVSLFFYLAISALLLLSLQFSLALSTAFHQRKAVAQAVALLEERVRQLERCKAAVDQAAMKTDPQHPD